ncbi:hypothetical protein [Haloechinothrix salitolerans]|uniref:Uncharacterized protein n=1 Tax=Haloechinothrix salitolerans TaxID=926830 RepID=A0ABW2C1M4_9PSEU
MSSAAALTAAVSVRYAREQYALGYAHGRLGNEIDRAEALSFARFFATRCEDAGELVDVYDAYRVWEASR